MCTSQCTVINENDKAIDNVVDKLRDNVIDKLQLDENNMINIKQHL